MTPDEIAIQAGNDIKIIWPNGDIQYTHHNRCRGLTRKIGENYVRPLVMIFIGDLPHRYDSTGKIRLFATLAKANVYIPATMAKI